MLPSLGIEQFRSFSALKIGHLGKVNLIVGKNNVGKTMLLEALRIYTAADTLDGLRSLLIDRDELTAGPSRGPDDDEFQLRVAALFHGRPALAHAAGEISIGPLDAQVGATLKIGVAALRRTRVADSPTAFRYESVPEDALLDEPSAIPGLYVTWGENRQLAPFSVFADTYRRGLRRGSLSAVPRAPFVGARGVSDRELAQWWDAIALRDAESRVVECLRLIAPVDRLTMIEHPARRAERMVMVRLAGAREPVPLKSLGDGMLRLFQIAVAGEVAAATTTETRQLAFVPERNKVASQPPLLIDEVENGVHYTALPRLWSFVFQLAALHDVQVFATSHSWDCIAGFQQAAADLPDIEASLIRLEQHLGGTQAVVFDREELATVAREHIEVR